MTKVNHFLFFILQVNFHGYALAGGGRGIERVELSVDGGKKWLEAHRLPKEKICAQGLDDDPDRPQWAWVLWELKYIKVYPPTTVIVKAVGQISYPFLPLFQHSSNLLLGSLLPFTDESLTCIL